MPSAEGDVYKENQKELVVMDHKPCLHPRQIPRLDESKGTSCNDPQAVVAAKT